MTPDRLAGAALVAVYILCAAVVLLDSILWSPK